MWYRPIVMYISCLPLICSIIAVFHIRRSKKLKGFYLSLGLFVLSLLSQTYLPMSYYPPYRRPHGDWLSCHSNLAGLGTAFIILDNEEGFKIPSNWCDYLILKGDVGESSLYCLDSGAIDGESSYALNQNLIGETFGDIPANVVLLFESDLGKDSEKKRVQERDFYNKLPEEEKQYFNFRHKVHKRRWNQIGGPEDIVIDRHYRKGCNILFTGGYSYWVDAEDIPALRWTVE